jgi:hypothetical protein
VHAVLGVLRAVLSAGSGVGRKPQAPAMVHACQRALFNYAFVEKAVVMARGAEGLGRAVGASWGLSN